MAELQHVEGNIPAPAAHAQVQPLKLNNDQPFDGIERRVGSLALTFWRELAAPRRYPALSQVTRESAPDLWEHFFIVDVGSDVADHIFKHVGAVMRQALDFDPTGQKVGEVMPPEIVGRSLYFQKAAVDLMAPIDEAGRWRRKDGADILYRAILMPLSDDQRVANYLLGAFNFRPVYVR